MAEIERSFLVDRDPPQAPPETEHIDQGYIAIDPDGNEVRVRRRGAQLTLTVKSGGAGRTRVEEEVTIDRQRFERLWPLTAGRRLEKDRQRIALEAGLTAELDVYGGALHGLRVVEVEFDSEAQAEEFAAPSWFGREITDDTRYRNRELALHGRPRE
jgi:adenylate cyclase